jgi:phage baseplate assembly protein W
MIYAPLIPLQFDDTYGYQNVADVKQLIKFHLTNLLLTNPGERITMPGYGVGIKQFLFENIGSGVMDVIESRVSSQIETYLNYISPSIIRTVDNEGHSISLQIQYSVESIDVSDVLTIDVDLNSGNVTTDVLGVNY